MRKTTKDFEAKWQPLTADQIEDARFRAKDRAWAAIVELFDDLRAEEGLSYQNLADRICRKKSQVHRWIDSPANMTLESFGLIAEGLNADVEICVSLRKPHIKFTNHVHPACMAEESLKWLSNSTTRAEPKSHEKMKRDCTFELTDS